MRLRSSAVRLARAVEQEVRARPRLHAAFYRVTSRSRVGNALLGGALATVRTAADERVPATVPDDDPRVVAARFAALEDRLRQASGRP